ncbi:MAG: DUF971 family protein [Candidatus Aldehydirespiratoraceae bacterium]|jgi:DUF971 family protein
MSVRVSFPTLAGAEPGHAAGMTPEFDLTNLDVDRARSVTATFGDGHVAVFTLTELRTECPCATCRDLRGRGEAAWPLPSSPIPLAITDASLHGAWGLNIVWNDGHSTGIYPFEVLRRWSDAKPGEAESFT